MVLVGPEVKSLRAGRATLSEAWAGERDGAIYLFGCTIPEWQAGSTVAKFEPGRPRKLLLHKKQVGRADRRHRPRRRHIVPLQIHFNDKGIAKVVLGIAEGRKKHDKRACDRRAGLGARQGAADAEPRVGSLPAGCRTPCIRRRDWHVRGAGERDGRRRRG